MKILGLFFIQERMMYVIEHF